MLLGCRLAAYTFCTMDQGCHSAMSTRIYLTQHVGEIFNLSLPSRQLLRMIGSLQAIRCLHRSIVRHLYNDLRCMAASSTSMLHRRQRRANLHQIACIHFARMVASASFLKATSTLCACSKPGHQDYKSTIISYDTSHTNVQVTETCRPFALHMFAISQLPELHFFAAVKLFGCIGLIGEKLL
jgi:hypothetical protein